MNITENVFWLLIWSIIGIIIIGFAGVVSNYNQSLDEVDFRAVQAASKHTQDMAKLGYVQKRATTCVEDKCTNDLIWVRLSPSSPK